MKKYKLTSETKIKYGITLYRIEALISFNDLSKGDRGGWIEREDNLRQSDDAWVYGDAQVFGNAQVSGDAQVSGNAQVYGNAQVSGDAWISGNAQVYKKVNLVSGYFSRNI